MCVVAAAVAINLLLVTVCSAAESEVVAKFQGSIEPLLETYCYSCHANGEKNGNVAFDGAKSRAELVANRALWWRVLKNVRAGIMPPAGEERPTADEMHQLTDWIKYQALGINPADPDPGRVTVRRLNREEYRNTIRDLMGIDFKAFEEFPPDDTGYGFDNIGDVLSVSPLLLEKYLQAAEAIVAEAVPAVSSMVREQVRVGRDFRDADGRTYDQLTFYKPADVGAKFDASHAGDYRLDVTLAVRGAFDFDPGRALVTFKIDGQDRWQQELAWQDNKKFPFQIDEKLEPGEHRITVELKPLTPAEEKRTSVDLRIERVQINGPLAKEHWVRPKNFERFFTGDAPAGVDERRTYAREVLARFARQAFRRPVDDRTLDRLVAIAEQSYGEPEKTFEQGVARAMVAVLASPRFVFRVEGDAGAASNSAYRDIDEYALASRLSYFLWSTMPDEELFRLAEQGELRKNLGAQLKRMLSDTRSNALVENFTGQWLQVRDVEGVPIDSRAVTFRDLDPNSEEFRQIQQFRRRFQPNQQQNNAAQKGAQEPAAKDGKRADDAKSADGQDAKQSAGVTEITAAKESTAAKDAADGKQAAKGKQPPRPNFRRRFFGPRVEFDRELRVAMRRETEMLFDHVLREDRSVLDLVDCDYTFLNERLAQHYGISGVTGRELRLVKLAEDSPRGGVLTNGSVLAVTSNPTRTSPVKRGLFVLDNIIGLPPPPPPASIPDLEDSEKAFKDHEPTLREVLEVHRRDTLCSSCHSRMDPLGLALENFNALGMWREKERGQPIEPAGALITGEEFKNIRELKQIIRDNRRTDFYRCLTEKLLTYALGRGLEDYDVEAVDRIIARLEKDDGRMSALISGIVESAPFQKRRTTTHVAAAEPATSK